MLDPIVAREIAELFPEGLDGQAGAAPAVPFRLGHALAGPARSIRRRPRLLAPGGAGGAADGGGARPADRRALHRGEHLRRPAHPARARVFRPRVHDVGHDRLAARRRGMGAHRRVVPEAGRGFYFADGHPAAFVFDGDGGPAACRSSPTPTLPTSPTCIDDPGDYADHDAVLEHAAHGSGCIRSAEVHRALSATPASPSTCCASTCRCRGACSRCWWEGRGHVGWPNAVAAAGVLAVARRPGSSEPDWRRFGVRRSPVIGFPCAAGWSSSVARWAHNPEVAGSNPVPATKRPVGILTGLSP